MLATHRAAPTPEAGSGRAEGQQRESEQCEAEAHTLRGAEEQVPGVLLSFMVVVVRALFTLWERGGEG